MQYTTKDVDRFWAKVKKLDDLDACWEWLGGKFPKGYGCMKWKGTAQGAHRISWEIANSDPGDLHVLHSCDNPGCVNPNHLFLGTNLDNIRDCVEKGRRAPKYGEYNGHTKLSDAQVMEIRQRYQGKWGQLAAFAREYGCTYQNIAYIVRGETRNK